MSKLERDFQAIVIKRIHQFWGDDAIVLKNDSGLRQGIPDLTVFLPDGFTAVLEVKPSEDAPYEPNQEWYLAFFDNLGYFTATIYPENEGDVFNALHQASRNRR